MKHISYIVVALLSIAMVGCFGNSSPTPIEFSGTAPTTVAEGEEYRYDIRVTPSTARNYTISAEDLPEWLELKTEEALPVNIVNFTGRITHLVSDGEDIYFAGTQGSDSLPAIYKTRINSTTSPQNIYQLTSPDELNPTIGFGGLAIADGVLYVAELKYAPSLRYTEIKKIQPAVEKILDVPGHATSIIVKNSTLHWADGSNVRRYLDLNAPDKITNIGPLTSAVGTFGFDAEGTLQLSLNDRGGYALVLLEEGIRPGFNSDQTPCLAGLAGFSGAGTYFAHTTCYANGEQIPGSLTFVAVDGPTDPAGNGGRVVYAPGEVVDGPASAVTVTASGKVVWASVAEQSLRTLTEQKNTLIGTPPAGAAGSYPIKLTLSNGKEQEFTITVTAPTEAYAVTGSVEDLEGTVRLSNNGTDSLSITNSGDEDVLFSFSKELNTGAAYDVAVVSSPAGQTCELSGSASGTVASEEVSVTIVCVNDTFTVGGSVSGLDGTLGLRLTGDAVDETLNVSADEFEFETEFNLGDEYDISIETQPAGQECELDNSFLDEEGEATTPVVSGPVSLSITCEDAAVPERTLSVTVEGLPSGTVFVRATGPEDGRWLVETKPFGLGTGSFTNTMRDGEEYVFQVFADPEGYTCLFNGSVFTDGIVDGNVTVTLTCAVSSGGGGGGGGGPEPEFPVGP